MENLEFDHEVSITLGEEIESTTVNTGSHCNAAITSTGTISGSGASKPEPNGNAAIASTGTIIGGGALRPKPVCTDDSDDGKFEAVIQPDPPQPSNVCPNFISYRADNLQGRRASLNCRLINALDGGKGSIEQITEASRNAVSNCPLLKLYP